jgi:hypothetical protein
MYSFGSEIRHYYSLEQVLPEGSSSKIIKGYGIYRKTPFLEPGVEHFQIQIALYWIKLRHKPEHIQKLQTVTN